jgi:hypothetical protein
VNTLSAYLLDRRIVIVRGRSFLLRDFPSKVLNVTIGNAHQSSDVNRASARRQKRPDRLIPEAPINLSTIGGL